MSPRLLFKQRVSQLFGVLLEELCHLGSGLRVHRPTPPPVCSLLSACGQMWPLNPLLPSPATSHSLPSSTTSLPYTYSSKTARAKEMLSELNKHEGQRSSTQKPCTCLVHVMAHLESSAHLLVKLAQLQTPGLQERLCLDINDKGRPTASICAPSIPLTHVHAEKKSF